MSARKQIAEDHVRDAAGHRFRDRLTPSAPRRSRSGRVGNWHDPLRQAGGLALRLQDLLRARRGSMTRPNVSVTVVSAPTTSNSPARSTSCSANAGSLPLDQEISAFGGVPSVDRGSRAPPLLAGRDVTFSAPDLFNGADSATPLRRRARRFPRRRRWSPTAFHGSPRRRDRCSRPARSKPFARRARRDRPPTSRRARNGAAFQRVAPDFFTPAAASLPNNFGQPFHREAPPSRSRPARRDRGRSSRRYRGAERRSARVRDISAVFRRTALLNDGVIVAEAEWIMGSRSAIRS